MIRFNHSMAALLHVDFQWSSWSIFLFLLKCIFYAMNAIEYVWIRLLSEWLTARLAHAMWHRLSRFVHASDGRGEWQDWNRQSWQEPERRVQHRCRHQNHLQRRLQSQHRQQSNRALQERQLEARHPRLHDKYELLIISSDFNEYFFLFYNEMTYDH